jgi:hypothetical protein
MFTQDRKCLSEAFEDGAARALTHLSIVGDKSFWKVTLWSGAGMAGAAGVVTEIAVFQPRAG